MGNPPRAPASPGPGERRRAPPGNARINADPAPGAKTARCSLPLLWPVTPNAFPGRPLGRPGQRQIGLGKGNGA